MGGRAVSQLVLKRQKNKTVPVSTCSITICVKVNSQCIDHSGTVIGSVWQYS